MRRERFLDGTSLLRSKKKKINNCIANSIKSLYENIDEYERQREIFILVKEKLIWLIKAQDVKSNFKALAAIKELAE